MSAHSWLGRILGRASGADHPLARAWPSSWLVLPLVLLALLAGGGAYYVSARVQEPFPHEQHARLFPFCTGCHEGVPTGDAAGFYPDPQLCTRCHDGEELARVTWSAPTHEVTNLRFTHPAHEEAAGEVTCERCHNPPGAAQRMSVARAIPANCFDCHEGNDHYVDADCEVCHVPLARTAFDAQRVNALALPEDHERPDFLLAVHGEMAHASPERCATCHTRERCTSCHVYVEGVEEIAALPAAPQGFPLGRLGARYPVPPSHRTPEWLERHGPAASLESCGTCHTRDDCAACHVQPLPAAVDALPARIGTPPPRGGASAPAGTPAAPKGGALLAPAFALPSAMPQDTPPAARGPGVGLVRKRPPSHAPKSFQTDHAALAAAQPENCQACHTKRFCEDCHDAPASPSFHPRNFTAQHASAAYGRRLECSTCHETRTFCRACHVQQGMGANARLSAGFHDAQPLWLLRHAQAARQGLESCTSCHAQRDCLQCHSTLGAFRVNPHGPDFDARRAQKRNPLICFACHVSDPLRKGTS